MIDADLRCSIVTLQNSGMGIREISRRLGVARNTVRSILADGGQVKIDPRRDSILIDEQTLIKLYNDCNGWKERVWEKLTEEHGVKVGYSTLTRKIRELGLGEKPRSAKVPDVPGNEMQHDTSPYRIKIGDASVNIIGSLIYYRYSKQFYLKFYRSFNRFAMKCFLHEALSFYGYAAPECIIDNTHLAVLQGTGSKAIMVPEMIEFTKRYGFKFKAHAIKHSDRKAGNERGFWTVETNFFPGRQYASMEDLNTQALEWATVRMANRPRGKGGIVPSIAFEHERNFLIKVPDALPYPYIVHERAVDQYGFVTFAANSYWISQHVHNGVKVLEYANEIKIFEGRRELARYQLPPDGTHNQIFPKDRPHIPYQPRHRAEGPTNEEEKILCATSPIVAEYLKFLIDGKGLTRHRIIRNLFLIQKRLSPELFLRVVERAAKFMVTDLGSLDSIARILVRQGEDLRPEFDLDETYESREAFHEGRFTDLPDFTLYDKILDGDQSEDG